MWHNVETMGGRLSRYLVRPLVASGEVVRSTIGEQFASASALNVQTRTTVPSDEYQPVGTLLAVTQKRLGLVISALRI